MEYRGIQLSNGYPKALVISGMHMIIQCSQIEKAGSFSALPFLFISDQ